jgi:hypothetical protein
MRNALLFAACLLLVPAVWAVGGEVEADVGMGLGIDVASFGIESVEPLAIVAPWIGKREAGQVGMMVAGSLSVDEPSLMMAPGARVWLGGGIVALYAAVGARAAFGESPIVTLLVLGGMRLEIGRLAFIAPGLAIWLYPTGHTEVWFCVLWRV